MTTHIKDNIKKLRSIRKNDTFVISIVSVEIDAPHTPKEELLRIVYAHMLKSGSLGYTREEFLTAEHLLGAHIDVHADEKFITITLKARNEVLAKALVLYKTMLTKPVWSNKELTRVKEYLTNQLALSKEDARNRARENFINSFVIKTDWRFGYENSVLAKVLSEITTTDLKNFHAKFFSGKWTATTGGAVSLCEKVEHALTSLPVTVSPEVPSTILPVILPTKPSLTLIDIPHKQNIEFSIGGAVPFTMNDPVFPAFVFGMNVLGIYGGFTGRLMSTVREKEGLTYMIYAAAEDITKISEGYWRISTFFSPTDCLKGISSTLREVARIHTKGITDDELIRFKNILTTRHTLVQDSLIKSVSAMHSRQIDSISEDEHKNLLEKIQNLTRDEVDGALRTYLNQKNITVSGAGPTRLVTKDLKQLLNTK